MALVAQQVGDRFGGVDVALDQEDGEPAPPGSVRQR
jgi:hypothetical protein